MIVIDNKFEIGQTVYCKTDKDQSDRIVTAILKEFYSIKYQVAMGTSACWFNDFELTTEKNILITTNS